MLAAESDFGPTVKAVVVALATETVTVVVEIENKNENTSAEPGASLALQCPTIVYPVKSIGVPSDLI
jgi:hypothetical protein